MDEYGQLRDDSEEAGFTAAIQQVLAAVDGQHALLAPICDLAGEVTDYRIVAASSAARDISGRQGEQLVGLRMRQEYPETVSGEVWEAYRAAYTDGAPRQVGPVPYRGPVTSAPAGLEIDIALRPAGHGVLLSWAHHDDQAEVGERIAQIEQLGNLGWSEYDLITGGTYWSEQLYRIYERDAQLGPPSTEEADALTVPENLPIRRRVAEQLGRGRSVDATYRIRTESGIRHIRVVADTVRDLQGRPRHVYGIVQDITSREVSRTRIAEVEQRLHEQQESLSAEHRLIAELQEIILPIPVAPIDLPGMQVAVRYLPAAQANRIGGDWYHAANARDGSVVLAVGDVAGHGLRAAAVMAQVRHAFAALASTATSDPAELLSHLNRLLFASGEPVTVASAVAARYQPATGVLRWAQAGHPAPLHTRAGVTTELNRPAGPLLGAVTEPAFDTASVAISTGDLLVFYTDGLVEHRGKDFREGLGRVMETLNELSAGGSQQPLTDLLTKLDRANPDDDTCVLGVRPAPLGTVPITRAQPDAIGELDVAGPAPHRHG